MASIRCYRKGCENYTIIHPTFGVLPCQDCQDNESRGPRLARSSEGHPIGRLHRIQKQRDTHAKDLVQPFVSGKPNPSFAKAYPDLAKDYYDKKELKQL